MTRSSGRRAGDTQEDEPVADTVLNTVLDTTVQDTTREAPMARAPVPVLGRTVAPGRYVEDLWVDDTRVPVLARPR